MSIEYEARVLEIDKNKLEEKLKFLGAEKIGDFNYRRRVYHFDSQNNQKWMRLRTDGNKTQLTVKEIEHRGIDGTKEYEIDVSSFENTNTILNKLGYIADSYQENKRTRYILDGVEIDIDSWPLIPTYVEIEGKSTEDVENMIRKLELDSEKVTTLDVQSVFKDIYNIDISKMHDLKFEN